MAQESRDRQLTPRISSPIYRTMMRKSSKSTRNSITTSLAEVEGGEEIYIAFETKGKGARIIPRTSSRMEWKIKEKKMERDR